jgi:hypothetical protein
VEKTLDGANSAIRASRLPAAQRQKEFAALSAARTFNQEERYISLPVVPIKVANPYGYWSVNDYVRSVEPFDEDAAMLELARVGVAVERYRVVHGAWPNQLSALTPEYLDETPTDVYDEILLHYIRRDEEIVVYSVGPDLKDDGGVDLERHRYGKTTGDIALTLSAPPTTGLN